MTAISSWIVTRSREETEALGERIGRAARVNDVLALWGELGAGKTALVRGVARGLGIPQHEVTSPTFVIVHEHHEGRLPLYHVDLYRIAPADARTTGWEEGLAAGGVTAIEWPDRVEPELPDDRLDVRIEHAGAADERRIRLEPTGPRSAALVEGIR
jgi:tRNA threonylcarbamoyladenosine biosynthesis protein TsaE